MNQTLVRAFVVAIAALSIAGCTSTASNEAKQPDTTANESGPERNWAMFAGAIDKNRADVVGRMLAQGVSPNTIVHDGDPALVRAIRMDNLDIARILLDHPGIDIDTSSSFGETALMLAAFKGNELLVDELLSKGASVNRVGGWTPLHYAAANGHDAIVRKLLAKGARVNVQTKSGVTPLYMAARMPSRQVVMTLLRAGAYRDLCNDKNQSPADIARSAGDEELAKFLAVPKCVKPSRKLAIVPAAK